MSDSVQPHRRQPTRFPCLWDSPGKNTGVRCHFLLQCMKVKSESEVAQSCPTLSDPMDSSPPGSSIHGIFQARVLEWDAIAFSECFLSRKVLVSPLTLPGREFLVRSFFSFQHFEYLIPLTSFSDVKFQLMKSANSRIGFPLLSIKWFFPCCR